MKLLAALAIVAVAAFAALALLTLLGSDRPSGERAAARGAVLVGPDGQGKVCRVSDRSLLVGYAPGKQPRPVCSPTSVPVRGIAGSLDGFTSDGAEAWATDVMVAGVWNGEELVADSWEVRRSLDRPTSPESTDASPPCQAPAGGWAAANANLIDLEEALGDLGQAVAARPDRYAGYWLATADDGSMVPVVLVAAGDTEDSELAEVYPFALCLVRTDRSHADLTALQQALIKRQPGWTVELDETRSYVDVYVILEDAAARAVAAEYGSSVRIHPLLRIAERP